MLLCWHAARTLRIKGAGLLLSALICSLLLLSALIRSYLLSSALICSHLGCPPHLTHANPPQRWVFLLDMTLRAPGGQSNPHRRRCRPHLSQPRAGVCVRQCGVGEMGLWLRRPCERSGLFSYVANRRRLKLPEGAELGLSTSQVGRSTSLHATHVTPLK